MAEVLIDTGRRWLHPLVSGLIRIAHFLSTTYFKTILGPCCGTLTTGLTVLGSSSPCQGPFERRVPHLMTATHVGGERRRRERTKYHIYWLILSPPTPSREPLGWRVPRFHMEDAAPPVTSSLDLPSETHSEVHFSKFLRTEGDAELTVYFRCAPGV